MDLTIPPLGLLARIIAIVSLLLGLGDASRLLGVSMGGASPIAVLGPAGFTYLAIFAFATLFAAVGLWIRASWGAVVLIFATGLELALYLSGNRDVTLNLPDFVIRLILLVAVLLLVLFAFRLGRDRVQD